MEGSKWMEARAWVLGLLLWRAVWLCPLTEAALAGEGEAHPSLEYQVRTWQTEDGLPQNSVPAIAQTTDGFLWVGTFNGLVRFDGLHFRTFLAARTPGLSSDSINELRVDRDGRMWIATDTAGLCVYDGTKFIAFPPVGPAGLSSVLTVAPAPDGAVWLDTRAGLHRFVNGVYSRVGDPREEPLPEVLEMAFDPAGRLWLGTLDGLFRWNGTRLERVGTMRGPTRVVSSRSGGLWAANRDSGLWTGDQQGWAPVPGTSDLKCTGVLEARDGSLWLQGEGTQGLFRRMGTNVVRVRDSHGLATERRSTMFLDRDDTLWIGSNGHGLHRLHRRVIQSVGKAQGLASEDVVCLLEDRPGRIWAGSYDGGLMAVENGRARHVAELPGAGQIVYSLARGLDGSLLAGHSSGKLLQWREGTPLQVRDMPWEGTRIVHQATDGTLWLGSKLRGVVRERGGEARRFCTTNGLGHDYVTAIVSDRSGDTWVGTKRGLHRIRGNEISRFGRSDGLGVDTIQTLYVDGRGVLWVGTAGGGLSRLANGRFETLDMARGLPNDVVAQVIEDDLGHFWIGSNAGLFRVERGQLEACFSGRISVLQGVRFGAGDGMPNAECAGSFQPTSIKASDGKLWFATVGGIVFVDPTEYSKASEPPAVHLLGMGVNGVWTDFPRLKGDTNEVRVIGPGIKRLEMEYTAVELLPTGPMQFRFRMDGIERDWVEARDRRSASYTELRPGRYRFLVTASGMAGGWNPRPAAIEIEVLPFWWQTAAFPWAAWGGWQASRWVRARHGTGGGWGGSWRPSGVRRSWRMPRNSTRATRCLPLARRNSRRRWPT